MSRTYLVTARSAKWFILLHHCAQFTPGSFREGRYISKCRTSSPYDCAVHSSSSLGGSCAILRLPTSPPLLFFPFRRRRSRPSHPNRRLRSRSPPKPKPPPFHLGDRSVGFMTPPFGVMNAAGLTGLVAAVLMPKRIQAMKAILELVGDEGVSQDRIVAVRTLHEQKVGRILHDLHGVGVIRLELVDAGQQGHVEIQLSDVGGASAGDCVVGLLGGAKVNDGYVEMSAAGSLAAWSEHPTGLGSSGGQKHLPWM